MEILKALLTKGFLPKELPPPFHSRDLQFLTPTPPAEEWKGSPPHARLVHYNHRRVGVLRRRLSFTNPVLYYFLCRVIDREWEAIEAYLGAGHWSLIRPVVKSKSRRAFAPWIGRGGAPKIAALARRTGTHLLRADVARFYPSIYTHSIPWALHGRELAKQQQKPHALVGNELDYWIRMGQDRQTMGLPIGPDASWVISDLMMTTIEIELRERIQIAGGHIIIDDIELVFASRRGADVAVSALEAVLNEFEMSLNPAKTRISRLPVPLVKSWTVRLGTFQFREKPQEFRTDLYRYFSLAFGFARQYPDEAVLKYALGRLKRVRVGVRYAGAYQALLLQCLGAEPSTAPIVERELRRLRGAKAEIDVEGLGEILHALIMEHAPLGHSSEVAWALWLGIVFDLPFDDDAVAAVCQMADSVVALVALHCYDSGLMPNGFDPSLWAETQAREQLWSEHWLLSYEANIKGWLPSLEGDHVNADPFFRTLKQRGVSFYRTRSRPSSSGPGIIPMVATDDEYDPLW